MVFSQIAVRNIMICSIDGNHYILENWSFVFISLSVSTVKMNVATQKATHNLWRGRRYLRKTLSGDYSLDLI